jgi:signal transduction histidine kinase/ActR/RegA family two-component response regulator
MSRVADNDFAVKVEERGRGELRRLAADFNRMMSAINRARSGLKQEVAQATAALASRTREAETANSAKTRFLAAASHDLRQPAHALSLYVAALKQALRQQPEPVRSMLLPAVDGMQAASGSLDALLNAVLDISRFDAGVVSPELDDVAVKPLIDDVLGTLKSTASEKGLKLRGRTPDVTLHTDPNLLRRILHNLVSNAIRFSRSGSILIAVRPRSDHVLLQVWDQGVGIAQTNLAQIFDEFFQVRRGDAGQGGMGLGLAIVARCVALLGGEIEARSILGRGSCFSVILPGAVVARRPMTASRPERAIGNRRVVLVLDDDALIRDSMRALLQAWGYEPKVEATLAALLSVAAVERDKVGAVIVDYRLQDGFTGINAAHRLQQIVGSQIPVMLITGDTSPERLRALEASGFPVMHKPLDSEQLFSQLSSIATSRACS